MLSLLHSPRHVSPLCNGMRRREFLQIGALGLGGITLSQLLAAESRAGTRTSHKSVIMIYLVGGPPHQDMFDLKPDAPSEIAGPLRPIATNVPGIEICELFPQLAQRTDKLAIIRSLVEPRPTTTPIQCFTGRKPGRRVPAGGWPQFGSAVVEAARAGRSRRCRRSSASATPARTARTTSPAPASSASASRRSGRWARPRNDMVLQRRHARPPRRPPARC